MGEAGFLFDARVWGGAVFKYFTTHSNGNPCVYDQSYQAGDTWVQISDTKPREILYMAFSAPNTTLPIITYMPSDGDQYREYDDQMPSILHPQPGQQRGGYLRPFVVTEYRRCVKVLHQKLRRPRGWRLRSLSNVNSNAN
ncbi:hypothetical protein TWF192_001388 [Orbilia oligospora]|uniref:Uncharacterized protein n=1 Tax=Orbilia oligospora TaxID=2813651 RepID=A0A6G1MFI4_ORBOL|nr:hypothetical protein TWF679_009814 [Orbilia oligospora]KAF3207613.1 hypothetical protein TWF191_001001 [Orbilia oligospora]KAF3257109.1 hypothetical protein TWF192_001388 [Orbilia oligospora]